MKLGARSLLDALDKALACEGDAVTLRRVDAEDLRTLMRPAAKQDEGKGMLVMFRLPGGSVVELDGSEREPSRLFIPTDEQRHSSIELASVFSAKGSEQDAINTLHKALLSAKDQLNRALASSSRPAIFIVP